MSEAVMVTLISTTGGVLVAAIGVLSLLVDRTRRHIKATRLQVENDPSAKTLGRIEDMQAHLVGMYYSHETRLGRVEDRVKGLTA